MVIARCIQPIRDLALHLHFFFANRSMRFAAVLVRSRILSSSIAFVYCNTVPALVAAH